jgi:hypothetical protein
VFFEFILELSSAGKPADRASRRTVRRDARRRRTSRRSQLLLTFDHFPLLFGFRFGDLRQQSSFRNNKRSTTTLPRLPSKAFDTQPHCTTLIKAKV